MAHPSRSLHFGRGVAVLPEWARGGGAVGLDFRVLLPHSCKAGVHGRVRFVAEEIPGTFPGRSQRSPRSTQERHGTP